VNPVPYIDIHTHKKRGEERTVVVRNLFPGEEIPAFTGRNFYSVGLHPWKTGTEEENNPLLQIMEDALELDHVILVGECGLDKGVENDFDEQLRVFQAQAFMAEEYQKPLLIHCVKAYNEIVRVFNRLHPTVPWIFHGYSANIEISRQLVPRNTFFSFGDTLFKEHAKALDSFRFIPLEQIFFETDEFEGHVEEIYQRGAALKGLPLVALKESVWGNFNRVENIENY